MNKNTDSKKIELECPTCFPQPLPVKTGVNAGKAAPHHGTKN